ncbi:MAG: sugar nucleotide-binding protein [Sulfurovaceae bacterium]|nr:sugar nucleotide-binding protein [Sulfurovaceae bacterium]
MNIIIGKNSFIAQSLIKTGKYLTTSSNIEDNESIYLNLSNPENFDYSLLNKNTTIILLAAVSSPDKCNNNYEYAFNINVIGTTYFIRESLNKGAKVLFFSSDVIYGNTINNVNEESSTNPFGNYAKMKDEIEKAFEKEKNFKVFRLSYVLSKEDKYLSYLQNCIDKNKIAEVFHPFNRKVVYICDVVKSIENIVIKWNKYSNQKFNICGIENISRKDIVNYFNEAIGNKLQYRLLEPNNDFWNARPKDINISSLYMEKLLGKKPTLIKDAINQIIKGNK